MAIPIAVSPPARDEDPPEVPDFKLLRPIGAGGYGEVWLAENRTTGRLRAVKLVSFRDGTSGPAKREIASLTHLDARVTLEHPGLLAVQHIGQTERHLFYVMELADDVSGLPASTDEAYLPATLANRFHKGPMSSDDCLRYARELVAALKHLNALGVVHRDVKPTNCLFVGGRLKLADFGLLIPIELQPVRIGTPRYMPPDGQMDAQADVYAAGLVLYEMLSGMGPESFPSLGDRARLVAGSVVLQRLNRIALHACRPDRASRYADAREMLADIEATPQSAKSARPMRVWALIGIAVSLLVVLATFAMSRPQPVAMNFLSEPFEATILLDGSPLVTADGTDYRTPCTVKGLTAGRHRVVFRHAGLPDRELADVDFSRVREVTARWPATTPPEPMP